MEGEEIPALVGADLSKAKLNRANLRQADLSEAKLNQADLSQADLSGAKLNRADLSRAALSGAHLIGAELRLANLHRADLTSAHLSEADLTSAKLVKAKLRFAFLDTADLRHADLSDADLSDAYLRDSDLSGAKLRGAELRRAWLGWTALGGLDLSEVKGLEATGHEGPSHLSTDTLVASRGRIPDYFLQRCGLTPWEILKHRLYDPNLTPHQIRELLDRVFDERAQGPLFIGGVFISYSWSNMDFVDKLQKRLTKAGTSVWFDREAMIAGPLQPQILRDRV